MHFFFVHFAYFATGVGSGFVGYLFGTRIRSEFLTEYQKLKNASKQL